MNSRLTTLSTTKGTTHTAGQTRRKLLATVLATGASFIPLIAQASGPVNVNA
ncbi:MAG: hypothetical protein MUF76_14820 [Hydrogenophaga sp.]|nr:hypothetical protein [Hydrogenophaga sp.]